MQRPNTTNAITYPDVLGMLTGGTRLNTEVVQCALGIYPRGAAIGQPFEALILLQNMCDQGISVSVSVQLPRKDTVGNRLSLFTPQDTVQAAMQPGEVGLLHIPIMPQLPTPPAAGYPISVTVDARRPRNCKMIREFSGGRVAGALDMSPYRLNILHEVGFSANMRSANTRALNTLNASFDILPGHIMTKTTDLTARYETLWSAKNVAQDQEKYAVIEARTHQVANGLTRTKIYEPLIDETNRRFSRINFALLPGEAIAIGKLLTYTMEDGLELEDGFKLTEGRWFQRLAAYIDDPVILGDNERLIAGLYTAVLHDAVRLGYHMVARTSKDNVGSPGEQTAQANRAVDALERGLPMELSFVYLPMALAGLMLHAHVKSSRENLWTSLEQIRVAYRTRSMSKLPQSPIVSKLIDGFFENAEDFLIRTRVPRP